MILLIFTRNKIVFYKLRFIYRIEKMSSLSAHDKAVLSCVFNPNLPVGDAEITVDVEPIGKLINCSTLVMCVRFYCFHVC